jgi:hypothetical protein
MVVAFVSSFFFSAIGFFPTAESVIVLVRGGRAVKHARLPAHEESADVVRAHRRKDFAYRVRDQASLRARDKSATVSRFPASVARA